MSVFLFLQDGRLTFDPGSKVVQLPYVNYIRELGTTFLNAYTNSPICCPSRAGDPLKVTGDLPLNSNVIYTVVFRMVIINVFQLFNLCSQQCGVVSSFTSLSHGTTTSALMLMPQHGWICWRRMDILPK